MPDDWCWKKISARRRTQSPRKQRNSPLSTTSSLDWRSISRLSGGSNAALGVKYFAQERLGLNEIVVTEALQRFRKTIGAWRQIVRSSLLLAKGAEHYVALVRARQGWS